MPRPATRGRGRGWSLLALVVLGHGCRAETKFDTRRDELREEIGADATVCPSVDEDFPCDPDGAEGHRCIANALQACEPAELYSFGGDGEVYWVVVPAGDTCELVTLSLRPAVLSRNRLRFSERTCGSIEAVPSESGSCTSFTVRDCE
ncbi:MAG: hypothetical protein AAF721_33595 [Myxococcota bacterium]